MVKIEYTYSDGRVTLPGKELTILDKLALDFVKHLDMPYVIVRGYVAMLFGRSTEDIDIRPWGTYEEQEPVEDQG